MSEHEAVLVVVDAQRAFVDRDGSLARSFGIGEVRPAAEALARLRQYLTEHRDGEPTIFVRSEYFPGQFTRGQLDHPLADLCVPGRNVDCEWAEGLVVTAGQRVVTKHQIDAGQSEAYRAIIARNVARRTRRIVLAGFQFTTCVAASALSTWQAIRGHGVRVAVVQPLTGARASSYLPGPTGISRVETTRRRLAAAGIDIIHQLD